MVGQQAGGAQRGSRQVVHGEAADRAARSSKEGGAWGDRQRQVGAVGSGGRGGGAVAGRGGGQWRAGWREAGGWAGGDSVYSK